MKTINKRPLVLAMALAMGATLGGCSSSSDSVTAETGTFIDSAVDGLTYKGKNFNGKTQGGGHYQFAKGDNVSFYLGDKIKLGQLLGSIKEVSPLDFFGPDATIDQRVLNILVLLQSLDSDGDTSNGITITEESIVALEAAILEAYPGIDLSSINLSSMDETEVNNFRSKLIDILTSVINATESPDDEIVSEEEAEYHFDTAISGDITVHKNISRTPAMGSGGHSIASMMVHTPLTSAAGLVDETVDVRPLLVSYTDTMTGDFLMGTGSSELPDIEHFADTFVALSLDKGATWKPVNISNTADNSSIEVDFHGDGEKLPYYGHSFKPAMKTEGNKVLVAWNDKFCPSGNPSNLTDPDTQDLYLVNGSQGTINYEGVEEYAGEIVPAHEVPFSCIWTARGVLDEVEHKIVWYAPEQLTSGKRDSNKVTIASDTTGFVLSWQEDPTGLRPGGGAGPGEGWSGATTNHKTDIWYSYIEMDKFAPTDGEAVIGGTPSTLNPLKPKAMYSLSSPVPISDNAVCKADNVTNGTGALYCADLCYKENGDPNIFTADEGEDTRDNGKCYSNDIDPIRAIYNDTPDIVEQQLLNGDTGASRPILGLFGSQVILGYEETKGEATSLPGVPNSETLDTIPLEDQGKIAYVHSFPMTAPTPIAAGTIVNELKASEVTVDNPESKMVLENVRRLTLVTQVDSKDVLGTDGNGTGAIAPNAHLWGILYKSGIETQGGSSDMYLRLAKGGYDVSDLNTAEDMSLIMGRTADDDNDGILDNPWPSNSWNLSSHVAVDDEGTVGSWSADNLDDATWENNWENTFSPRGYLSGDTIFIGYEYTPSWRLTGVGHLSNNFTVTRSDNNGTNWTTPFNVSNITNNIISTLDPRLIPTSEAIPGLETREPNTVFITYGTVEMGSGIEEDLFLTRSTDGGDTWEKVPSNPDASAPVDEINEAITQSVAEEKEVQNIASPDGKTLYSLWLQELDPAEAPDSAADYLLGSDIWAQRKDYTDEIIVPE